MDTGVTRDSTWLWFLLPAGMLVVGLLPLPYGYYTLMRIAVTISAGVAAYLAYRASSRVDVFVVVGAIVAVVFNPIIPVFLNKGLWSAIDLAAAAWFVVIALRGSRAPATSSSKVAK